MPKAKQPTAKQLAELKAENNRLKKQVATLSKKQKTESSNKWRTALIVLMAGLAGAILVVANLVFWTGRTLVETPRYTAAVQSLIEQPAVQQAIATKTTDALFERVDVSSLLQEALPPKAEFAVPTLTSQIQSTTKSKAQEIVASPQFEQTWVNANSKAHERFINLVRNYQGDGTIDISDVYKQLSTRLEDGKLSFLANKQLPDKIGSIQVFEAPRLKQAHWLVVNLNTIRAVTILLFLALTAGAIAIARNRRRVTVQLGVLYATLMFASLIAVRVARAIAVDKVNPQYQEAASQAWQAILHPFVLQTASLMALGLVVALIAWVTGSGKRAQWLQKRAEVLLSGKLHEAIFGKKENRFTNWVGRNKTGLEWLAVGLAFVALLIVSITFAHIIWLAIGLLAVVAVIEICAAKK